MKIVEYLYDMKLIFFVLYPIFNIQYVVLFTEKQNKSKMRTTWHKLEIFAEFHVDFAQKLETIFRNILNPQIFVFLEPYVFLNTA